MYFHGKSNIAEMNLNEKNILGTYIHIVTTS